MFLWLGWLVSVLKASGWLEFDSGSVGLAMICGLDFFGDGSVNDIECALLFLLSMSATEPLVSVRYCGEMGFVSFWLDGEKLFWMKLSVIVWSPGGELMELGWLVESVGSGTGFGSEVSIQEEGFFE